MMELLDTVHHLIVLCDDMREIVLLLVFLSWTVVQGTSIVGQATSLTQLLEDYAIHTSTEILIEHSNGSGLIWVPWAVLIVIHAHIDILGIVRSQPYLILHSCLILVCLIFRNGSKFLTRLMGLVDDGREFSNLHRTVIEHTMLIVA